MPRGMPRRRLLRDPIGLPPVWHYRALLGVTTDPSQRRSIEQLLHDEEAKLKKYDEDNKKELSGSSKTA